MKLSLTWLKDYVDVPWSPQELGDRLTAVGLEVEAIDDQAKTFEGFVVGHVKECGKHPKADRLSVCSVDIREETLQIVCGAPNVAVGQKVIVGRVGAVVPHDQHDPEGKPFTLSKVKLRGVESSGMICSAKELGLGEEGDGIVILDPSAAPGTPLAEHLGRTDVILEVGITPNRADCLSHIGIAREVSMLTGGPVRTPTAKVSENAPSAQSQAKVSVHAPDLCSRYAARVISHCRQVSSPQWMQSRLTAVGMRPINLIVDVTNYVMMEYGQPLHAFDLAKVKGARIDVKRAGTAGTFRTLDGKERTLTPDTLVICDAGGPVAVAGVMGGENSEVSGDTTTILIESANFQPSSVRRTARAFGLQTEASYRFERGVDRELPVTAVDRAASLLQEFGSATVHEGVIDVYPGRSSTPPIRLRPNRANEVLGTTLTGETIAELLGRVGCIVTDRTDGTFDVTPPSYRVDISQEIDLVEEVARALGYDHIETKTRAAIDFSVKAGSRSVHDEVRAILVGQGFNEIMTLSLQQEKLARLTHGSVIRVLNPVSAEMQVLRNSLIPAGLQVIRSNLFRSQDTLRLFELGSVFGSSVEDVAYRAEDIREDHRLTMYMVGARNPGAFDAPGGIADLFDLKGEVEALLKRLYLDKYRFIPYDAQNPLTEQVVRVELYGRDAGQSTKVGWIGRISGEVCRQFEIDVPVFICELEVSRLGTGLSAERVFRPLPKFPAVQRDLAFIVDANIPQSSVESTIRETAGPLLVSAGLFDVYAGSQAGKGNKSLAYTLKFRSETATLTDAEVDRCVDAVVKAVRAKHGATLRS